MIELFIEGRKIDITDDLEINFTYESIDGDKLSNIKNSFSKTVNIQGTANNNITFGHIWRFDKYIPISNASNIENFYNPKKKVEWFINKNGAVINRGYCTLDNINVKNERQITYQLTLYGGIGDFFYNLAYNDDGSPKTLYDMFWNWYAKLGLVGYDTPLTQGEEATETIMKCSAEIVASSYHSLSPANPYTGRTEINKDIVFVPCYTGLYDNFDAKHMLVSTYNNSAASYVSTATRAKLQAAFPDSYTEDGKTYTTLNRDFEPTGYRYGLVTFPRDVDAWEAGDLRVNELPVAIRLSKLMTVISQPYNNGGYEVEWDGEIKNSYHWNYGWVMLGKLKLEKDDLNLLTFSPSSTYDGQQTIINVDTSNGSATAVSNAVSYDIPSSTNQLTKGNYTVSINVFPNLIFKCSDFNWYVSRFPNYISGSMHDNGTAFRYVWTVSVLVHKIYDGTTLLKSVADVFYFSTNPTYGFGYNKKNVSINDIKTALNGKINQRLMGSGEFIDEYRYHNCKLENPTVTGDGHINTVSFTCGNVQMQINLNTSSDITNFRVEQSQGMFWANLSNTSLITAGKYGTDAITFNVRTTGTGDTPSGNPDSVEAPFGFITASKYTCWSYNLFASQPTQNYSWAFFEMNESRQNGVLDAKSSGFNILELDKKTLFANSQSPMKYLSGFCKMMNYRFICDNTSKKIQIKTLKNYYINRTLDINDRVDIGRDINIKNVTTPNKTINIGLRTAETYPVSIINRVSKEKFNTVKYDTGIKYNASETNLLEDLTFENVTDWQQNSVFYNINPQYPKPYNVQSISWTLFNVDSNDSEQIEKKEIFTVGTPSNSTSLLANADFLPKIALFDKDNKTVDFESSLIFLNGFVKNYDYTQVGNDYVISPRVSFSNDMYEQFFLNQERCYVSDFKYSDVFPTWGCYSSEQQGTATSWVLPMFSRDLYNGFQLDFQTWQPAAYKLASFNLTNQDGLDNIYSLSNTTFISNPNYSYAKTVQNTDYASNEYTISSIPLDIDETRIYTTNWVEYLDDLYDTNTRDVTAYVDLSGLGEANQIMRYFYAWKSHLWIITKLENFKIAETTHDKFTKVRLHKIKDKSTWTRVK